MPKATSYRGQAGKKGVVLTMGGRFDGLMVRWFDVRMCGCIANCLLLPRHTDDTAMPKATSYRGQAGKKGVVFTMV